MATQHSRADKALIDGLSFSVLREFRDFMYSAPYIQANPYVFLDTAWIDTSALRSFLAARDRRDSERDIFLIPSSSPEPSATHVKSEFDVSDASSMDRGIVSEQSPAPSPVRTRSVFQGGHEVIELLSDSDEENYLTGAHFHTFFFPKSIVFARQRLRRHPICYRIICGELPRIGSVPGVVMPVASQIALARTIDFLKESDSDWAFDSDELMQEHFGSPTQSGSIRTFRRRASRGEDNDSWKANGGSSSLVEVAFVPGEPKVLCPRSRGDCRGIHACTIVDRSLLNVPRYELDVTARDAISAAQQETRRTEGETAEHRATAVQSMSCTARHSDGRLCGSKPELQAKPEAQGTSRGHDYLIFCDGWTPQFKESHRCHSIPDNVQ
ncbi:hypothetical protein FB451DRAFT_1454523 [Mycena latifolia]|nr:hypothetical protein FB451DRAFT_1454523 [Mycena latifolia]